MTIPFDPSLLDAIERLVVRDWKGSVWRVTIGDTFVLRTNTSGGRWNRPGVEALYGSLSREAAAAEVEHLLARQPVPVRGERKANQLSVHLSRVLDISSSDAARELACELRHFVDEDVGLTQTIGSAAEWLGVCGLLAPSARHADSNLVVFVKNLGPDDRLEIVPIPNP
jgi:RES domain-containing protein